MQPCNLYWIYSFPICGPQTPRREEVSTALSLSPKTICYDTHRGTHNGVNTHRQTHTYRGTRPVVHLQGTLPHSKEVIAAHFLSLWEVHWGQDILRFVTDRNTQRITRTTDTVSYFELVIVCHMDNIALIYKSPWCKRNF